MDAIDHQSRLLLIAMKKSYLVLKYTVVLSFTNCMLIQDKYF